MVGLLSVTTSKADISHCDADYLGGTLSFSWIGSTASTHSGHVTISNTTPSISGFADINQSPTNDSSASCKLYNGGNNFECTIRLVRDLMVTSDYEARDASGNLITTESVCPGNVCKNDIVFLGLNYNFTTQSANLTEIPKSIAGSSGSYLYLKTGYHLYSQVSCH